jgi:DNA-binding transcriptional ArsR family regulator
MLTAERRITQHGVPDEVKAAVRALDSPIRWKIIELLRAKRELSYTELTRSLDIKKGQLTYHINELLKGAIVQNYSKDGVGSKFDSFYEISRFGEAFLDSLVEPMQPKPVSFWVTSDVSLYPGVRASLSAGMFLNPVAAGIGIGFGAFISNARFQTFKPITGAQTFVPIIDELYARLTDAGMNRSILSAGKEVSPPAPPTASIPEMQEMQQ